MLDKLLNNKPLRYFIGICCIFLIISAILRAFTTPPPPVATVIGSDTKLLAELQFSVESLTFPKELTVYTAQSKQVDRLELAKKLAEAFNMETAPVKNHWVNKQEDSVVFLENNDNYVVYSKYITSEYTSVPNETIETATKKVLEFFQTHQLITNVEITHQDEVVFEDEGFHVAKENETPDGYQYALNTNIEGIPYYPHTTTSDLATAWTDLSGNIVKIRVAPTELSFQKVETYQPLSLNQIQQEMKSGLITYVLIQKTIAGQADIENITSIDFSNAQLEYRENKENGYILPYLRFSGVGVDKNQQQYYIEAISPAIKVE